MSFVVINIFLKYTNDFDNIQISLGHSCVMGFGSTCFSLKFCSIKVLLREQSPLFGKKGCQSCGKCKYQELDTVGGNVSSQSSRQPSYPLPHFTVLLILVASNARKTHSNLKYKVTDILSIHIFHKNMIHSIIPNIQFFDTVFYIFSLSIFKVFMPTNFVSPFL